VKKLLLGNGVGWAASGKFRVSKQNSGKTAGGVRQTTTSLVGDYLHGKSPILFLTSVKVVFPLRWDPIQMGYPNALHQSSFHL